MVLRGRRQNLLAVLKLSIPSATIKCLLHDAETNQDLPVIRLHRRRDTESSATAGEGSTAHGFVSIRQDLIESSPVDFKEHF